jgi:hypothetical protein
VIWGRHEPNKYVSGIIAIGSPLVWWTFLIFLVLTLGQSVIVPWILAVHYALRKPPPDSDPQEVGPASFRQRLGQRLDQWRFGPEAPWIFLVLLYLPQVLLWSVNSGFLFYMLPCIPFMCILVGAVLSEWSELYLGRLCSAMYLLVALVCMIAQYPLLIGYPVPYSIYDILIPFKQYWV